MTTLIARTDQRQKDRREKDMEVLEERRSGQERRRGQERRLTLGSERMYALDAPFLERPQSEAQALWPQQAVAQPGIPAAPQLRALGQVKALQPVPVSLVPPVTIPAIPPERQGAAELDEVLAASPDRITDRARQALNEWRVHATAPHKIEPLPGTADQQARAGQDVRNNPGVKVTDVNGDPVVGAIVTFGVEEGGGTITEPHGVREVTVARVRTDGSGQAVLGSWRLGDGPGVNRLIASVGSVSTGFKATGTEPPHVP